MNEPEKQIFKSIVGNPLKINLNINIDNQPTIVVLTSAILYYPPKENPKENPKGGQTDFQNQNQNRNQKPNQGNQYPLLPPIGIDYPIKKLTELPFREMVKVLFDPDRFTKQMTKWVADTEKESALLQPPPNEEEFSKLYSEENEKKINWEKKNVQMLLHLLFPTYYFGSLEYKTSMHYWNPNETFHTFPISRTFSYLKYNGKVYTITNCVWLNDILNSPAYKPYVDGFKSYYLWTLYIKNVIKKRIIQEKRKMTKFEKENNQTNNTENAEGTPKQENPMIAFIENNIQNLKGLSEKITETENSIELSIVKLRPVFRKNNLMNLTQNASNYLESFTKMPIMSDKNTVLNEFFDVINEYVYDMKEEEEVIETDTNKETPEVTNHMLLYKLLKNIFLFKSHKKNLSQLLNRLPPIQNNYDVYFYTGLNTKRSEDYYRQNLFTDVILDVVDGLVDDSNKSVVKCYYYDHWIGKMMNFFNGTYWDVAKDRVYVNLLNVQNKVEDKEDDIGNGNNPDSGPPPGYGDGNSSSTGNGDSGYGNSGYGNSGYENSYDTMMPSQQRNSSSSDQAKKNTADLSSLTVFFNQFILDTNNLSKTISKNKKELLKKILLKIQNTELYMGKGLDLEFELFSNIVKHKGVDVLSRIVIPNTNMNDEIKTIKSYDDFLLENTTTLKRLSDVMLSRMNPSNNTGIVAEWNDNKSKVVKMIQAITVDIEKFLNKINQTPTTDILVEYKGLNEQQRNIYSIYLLLFLYKNVFELVKDYYERKISELNGKRTGGKTQKYSHAHHLANNKTRKNHK
jgi:hypothetical protein